ncbi:MAG: protein phosphatase 2C domain-containing protein [Gemmatimonadota bacterium]|nr:protein phosphatase 2C domain-containing protein [Gemmatimonadota bacterium]MDH4347370.1 protein phosphatase 2C domain-containing protein [Gemmatimonadota bacterium]MDH5283060.1 protein phosphatase 2C domain-containing protein [Gemmatimonadota bacterium]
MSEPQGPLSVPRRENADIHGVTHPGLVRKENQDHFLIATIHKVLQVFQTSVPAETLGSLTSPSRGFVFLVADGVGGGPGGKEASRTALKGVVDYVVKAMDLYVQIDPAVELEYLAELLHSVEKSHELVRQVRKSEDDEETGATTLTMVCIRWPRAYMIHVGDSRCYRLRNGELELLTVDQTMAQAMVESGALSPDQAERSALKHVLYSAIGGSRAEPYTFATDLEWNDVMLLCTDGLTKHVSDTEIRDALRTCTDAKATAEELLQLVLDRGASDNTTVVIGRLRRPPAGSGAFPPPAS